jgi:hypothetical protein
VLHIEWRLVELVVLILVVVVVLLVLTRGGRYLGHLIVNGIVGVVLLLLTNLVLADDIPINLLTILICAIGGLFCMANHPCTPSVGRSFLRPRLTVPDLRLRFAFRRRPHSRKFGE